VLHHLLTTFIVGETEWGHHLLARVPQTQGIYYLDICGGTCLVGRSVVRTLSGRRVIVRLTAEFVVTVRPALEIGLFWREGVLREDLWLVLIGGALHHRHLLLLVLHLLQLLSFTRLLLLIDTDSGSLNAHQRPGVSLRLAAWADVVTVPPKRQALSSNIWIW